MFGQLLLVAAIRGPGPFTRTAHLYMLHRVREGRPSESCHKVSECTSASFNRLQQLIIVPGPDTECLEFKNPVPTLIEGGRAGTSGATLARIMRGNRLMSGRHRSPRIPAQNQRIKGKRQAGRSAPCFKNFRPGSGHAGLGRWNRPTR